MLRSRLSLATVLLLACLAASASAQEARIVEEGAALALPFFTTEGQRTTVTITNIGSEALDLRVTVIDGDSWASRSFDCPVTASESTLFYFTGADFGASFLQAECDPLQGEDLEVGLTIEMSRGILFVATSGRTDLQGANTLVGDATIERDVPSTAWSVPAIAFRRVQADAPGWDDDIYRFDGAELAPHPASLTTHFLSPDAGLDAQLILFTLDGRVGRGPQVSLDITAYDDDENRYSASLSFECFRVISLGDINANFERLALGSDSGHVVLRSRPVAQSYFGHDRVYDGEAGDDAIRSTPVLGWIVQHVVDSPLVDGQGAMRGRASFARVLQPSIERHVPSPGDVPVLDGRQIVEAAVLIERTILRLDEAIELGEIEGAGRLPFPFWNNLYLNAYRFAAELAQNFVLAERERPACFLLDLLDVRSDGQRRPRDWVRGPAVPEINGGFVDTGEAFECPNGQ